MKPGQPVEVNQILAGGRELLTAWCDGYEFVRDEPASGCYILKCTRGLYEGMQVRYKKIDVREK